MAGELHFANPGQEGIDPAFASLLGETAKEFGGLRVTSGRRSPERNKAVGGAKNSFHLHGSAADIDMSGMDEAKRANLVKSLRQHGAKGFITYSDSPNMLHVDMRPGKAHFMHDKSAENIGKAPEWFQALAFGKEPEMASQPADNGRVEAAKRELLKRRAKAELERRKAAKPNIDPATNQPEGVPEFKPVGVEGYNPETGEVEKTGAVDKIGAFITSAIEGVPIAGPTLKKGATGAAAGIVSTLESEKFGDVYDDMTRNTAEVEADNPNTATAGYLTGAILPMVGLGATALGGRALGVTGNSFGGRVAASGVSNALISGADTGVRGGDALDVAKSAGIGGVIGLAIPSAGKALNSLGGAIRDTVAPRLNAITRPGFEAERRVGAAMSRDAANAPVLGSADEASAAANQQQLLNVDRGGETTRALARSAANTDPEARELIAKTASDRFGSQGDRARSFIDRITGGATDDLAVQEGLRNAARRVNDPAYKRAFAHPAAQDMGTPELLDMLNSPAVRAAAADAEKRGADRAVVEGFETVRNPFVFDEAGNVTTKEGVKPTLQFWNQVKINLDGELGKAVRAGDDTLARDLRGLKNRLVLELDTAVPDYQTARQGAAAFFGAEDAIDAGKKFVTMNRQNAEVAAALKKMKPAERTSFAVGFASELKDAIAQAGDRTNVINKIFGSQQSRDKIKLALGQKAFGEFEQFVKVENAMDMLRGAMGNSTTARQLAELGLAGGAGLGATAFTGDWKSGLGVGILTGLARRYGAKVDERVTKRVAELLLSDDPQALKKAVTLASNSPKASAALEAIQSALSSALKGAGQTSTRPERKPLEITVTEPNGVEVAQ